MTLILLLAAPLLAGLVALAPGRGADLRARVVALAALLLDLALALALWWRHFGGGGAPGPGWLAEFDAAWIPAWGARLHLAVDGISLALVLLTCLLGIVAVAAAWRETTTRVGAFHFLLLWSLAGILGVFLAVDLFLFALLWELMLVPLYFLIALWGHEQRAAAALKFFLFTQVGGLLLLASILGLSFAHAHATGVVTFDYRTLLGTPLSDGAALWLFLGFLAAFAVKLPAVPLHTWLPDAHTQAPTAGSVILAGLLLKTGAYGLLRFAIPLFPGAAAAVAPVAMAAGVVGILYGSVLAVGQRDLKRFVAYTSVGHMGFVLLGIFVGNRLALHGALLQMVCHGLGAGGLFFVAGTIQQRTGTRDLDRLGGLQADLPRLSGAGLLLALAALGLPGLGTFLGEFLVLLGTARVSLPTAAVAAAGLVFSAIAALSLVQRAFLGAPPAGRRAADIAGHELGALAVLVAALVAFGLFPQPLLDTARQGLDGAVGAAGAKRQPPSVPLPGGPHGPR
jgi:NADH-quinone oxidoreductase subunit M